MTLVQYRWKTGSFIQKCDWLLGAHATSFSRLFHSRPQSSSLLRLFGFLVAYAVKRGLLGRECALFLDAHLRTCKHFFVSQYWWNEPFSWTIFGCVNFCSQHFWSNINEVSFLLDHLLFFVNQLKSFFSVYGSQRLRTLRSDFGFLI